MMDLAIGLKVPLMMLRFGMWLYLMRPLPILLVGSFCREALGRIPMRTGSLMSGRKTMILILRIMETLIPTMVLMVIRTRTVLLIWRNLSPGQVRRMLILMVTV